MRYIIFVKWDNSKPAPKTPINTAKTTIPPPPTAPEKPPPPTPNPKNQSSARAYSNYVQLPSKIQYKYRAKTICSSSRTCKPLWRYFWRTASTLTNFSCWKISKNWSSRSPSPWHSFNKKTSPTKIYHPNTSSTTTAYSNYYRTSS